MEYLKLFENHSQYEDFTETKDFIKPNVSYCIEQEEVHYNPFIHDYSKDYLTFVALENNVSFRFKFGTIQGFELSYSLDDGSTWNIFEDQNGNIITINKGEKILWKGQVIPTRLVSIYAIGHFLSDGPFDVMGNIMSLVSSDDFIDSSSNCPMSSLFRGTDVVNANNLILTVTNDNCYSGMFEDCTNLITPPKLPTTLAVSCYSSMFSGCTSLTTAPVLPATTLADSCYHYMFYGCTSLTTAPELPATTLAYSCYSYMFSSCKSLITAPELPATTMADYCYSSMFSDCTSLTTAPELPATTLAERCYQNMFDGCTSLTTAPELLASTLVQGCYARMFRGCTNLNYIKCLAIDISAFECTFAWVQGVAENGTFIEDCDSNFSEGINGIPENWNVDHIEECPK